MGIVLVAISAALFAVLWLQASSAAGRKPPERELQFLQRRLRRRIVANGLVGLVGVGLILFDQVPRTPLAITAYLLLLVLAAGWIMVLGLADWHASRQYLNDRQLDELAQEFKRANLEEKRVDLP